MASWGILGTGRIARKFVEALAPSAGERVVAVASRDEARAAAFARELGVARGYGSYEALLADPEVAIVYVALPPNLHAAWCIAAARAGKHVLCEKPLATSAAEAEAMFAAARDNGVWLMEGFMYRFHPQTQAVERLLREGAVGAVRLVRVSFGTIIDPEGNIRFDPALGGGALGDLGCYCVSMARLAAGERPARVSATSRLTGTGVDEFTAGTLEYPSGAVAQIACGMRLARHQRTQIVGDDGVIELDMSFSIPADQALTVRLLRGGRRPSEELIAIPPADHFLIEAEGFAALTATSHGSHGLPEVPLAESLDNAATIDALRDSARLGRAVELTEIEG
jgi:D-xylose 1-dehydrogenase (NADP+, D-xylono-1,5-lactone-forming)